MQWYALQTKPHKEMAAWHQLLARNLDTFYPHLPIPSARSQRETYKPYFPRYLFVRVNLALVGLSPFQYMPHVIGLVCFGGEPAPVADTLIQAIQRRVTATAAAGGELFDGLRRGDQVSICDGPFTGYDALFDARLSGGERVRVLLQVLGQQGIFLEMNAASIRRARRPQTASARS